MTSLRDAIAALNARKTTVASEWTEFAVVITPDGLRRAMVGMDLDFDEVRHRSVYAGVCTVTAISEEERDPVVAVASTWIDGLLTGLLLAELRAREEAAE